MHYLKIATAKNGEPYVLLMREERLGLTVSSITVAWSETYRSISGAKNLVRIIKEAGTFRWRVGTSNAGSHLVLKARNNRTLMSGVVMHPDRVEAWRGNMAFIGWAGIEVRDER